MSIINDERWNEMFLFESQADSLFISLVRVKKIRSGDVQSYVLV